MSAKMIHYVCRPQLFVGLQYWGYAGDDEFGDLEKPYWYVKKPGALSVETTAYALLTQLTLNDVTASNPIVAWLLQQREEHGSFVSTQVSLDCLFSVSLCLCLSVCLSACLPACLSVCLSVCLCLCRSLSVSLSVCLSENC